jgi:hypothetical protein
MLWKIKNHIICKEFFYKNQWVILALWVSALIYIQGSYRPKQLISYALISSYVDYTFGFIKRGLLGEILNILSLNHFIFLTLMTYWGVVGFVVTLTYQLKERLNNVDNVLTYLFLMLSPLFLKNYVFLVGYSEIIFFIFLLLITFGNQKTANICLIIYPITLLIHEGLALMFFPASLFISYLRFENTKNFKASIIISIVLFLFLFGVILKYGQLDVPIKELRNYIFSRLKKNLGGIPFSITKSSFEGSTRYWNFTYAKHLEVSWSYKELWNPARKNYIAFTCIILINLIIIKTAIKNIRESCSVPIIVIMPFLTSGYILLMIIAFDRIRFSCIMFGILLLCAVAKNKDLFFTQLHQQLNKYPLAIRLSFIVFSIIIPFSDMGFNPLNN